MCPAASTTSSQNNITGGPDEKKLLAAFVLALLAAVSLNGCKPKADGYAKTVEDFFAYLNVCDFASAGGASRRRRRV
jgi:hypothetical protein